MFWKWKWSSLFLEDGKVSLGRISFWITFSVLVWFWIRAGLKVDVNVTIPDAPDSLQYTVLYLLAYNMGKKIKGIWTKDKKEVEMLEE